MRKIVTASVLALAGFPVAAHAGATMRIDEQRSITIAVGVRSAFSSTEQGAPDAQAASKDPVLEGAILALSGELSKGVRIQLNGGRGPLGELRVVDAILQLEPSDYVKLWTGRLLPASDRATFTGPFFGATWDPAFVAAYPSAFAGRDDGAVLWGAAGRGLVKWHAGAFRGRDGGTNTQDDLLYSGRVALSLWEPEPGYYSSGTYHGTRDVLTVAAGARMQRNGAGIAPNPAAIPPVVGEAGDFLVLNADLFVERRLGAAGTATLEGAFYRYERDVPDPLLLDGDGWYASGAWLLPVAIGRAKLQPAVRFQRLEPEKGLERSRWDGTLNVILNGHFAKFGLTVSGERLGEDDDRTTHAVKLGAQIIL